MGCEDFLDEEEEHFWEELCHREKTERKDNEPPSGSTDLDNLGDIEFCH